MLVPFLNKFKGFGLVLHTLPFEKMLSLGFAANSVEHGAQYKHKPKKSSRGYLVTVQYAGHRDTKQNASRHDESKHDGTEILG